MINNIDNKLNICGIYKINYDNGKIYIGQARSIYARALEHNSKNKYPCDKALKKHNATIEILQRITDINLLDKAESFYNSWKTLILRDTEHRTGFKNNGAKEKLKLQ